MVLCCSYGVHAEVNVAVCTKCPVVAYIVYLS